MLHVDSVHQGTVTTLQLEGDVDEMGVQDLREALLQCLRDKRYNVVINLNGVRFISYMGLGVFVERLRQFRKHDGDMKLVGLNLYTERLFRMVGVTTLFETYDDEAAAVQGYQEAA